MFIHETWWYSIHPIQFNGQTKEERKMKLFTRDDGRDRDDDDGNDCVRKRGRMQNREMIEKGRRFLLPSSLLFTYFPFLVINCKRREMKGERFERWSRWHRIPSNSAHNLLIINCPFLDPQMLTSFWPLGSQEEHWAQEIKESFFLSDTLFFFFLPSNIFPQLNVEVHTWKETSLRMCLNYSTYSLGEKIEHVVWMVVGIERLDKDAKEWSVADSFSQNSFCHGTKNWSRTFELLRFFFLVWNMFDRNRIIAQ